MKRIAIAGGIGAGKSAATNRLSEFGFTVVDADEVAHQVVEPGEPAWQALRDAFGDAILASDRTLDRPFVAQVVFNDATALRRLNSITHGYIGTELIRQIRAARGAAVFVALPLFRPEHRKSLNLDEVWSVQASPEVAIERLVKYRSFSEEDARARLGAQMSNAERAAIVDHVIWNDGTLNDLYQRLDVELHRCGLSHG
jgi:dephospho-CoA kinase